MGEIENKLLYLFDKGFFPYKKFGREGEGPSEFKLDSRNARGVMIALTEGEILVNSVNKLSFFTKSGTFINEDWTNNRRIRFQAVGEGKYVGECFAVHKRMNYSLRNLYDSDFKRGKELYRRKSFFQPN